MKGAFISFDVDIAGQPAEIKWQAVGEQQENTRGREYCSQNN